MEDIVCESCGSVNDYEVRYRTFRNGTKHKEAYCTHCDKHITFLKQTNKPRTYIPFGKFKGQHTYQVDDLEYLKWFFTIVDDERLKLGVKNRISELTYGGGNG